MEIRRARLATSTSSALACYHRLFCFNQFGDLERSLLRPGNVYSVDDWRIAMEPVVALSREVSPDWPTTAFALALHNESLWWKDQIAWWRKVIDDHPGSTKRHWHLARHQLRVGDRPSGSTSLLTARVSMTMQPCCLPTT